MKLVLQRVAHASVEVERQIVGQIGCGLLVLVGVGQGDADSTIEPMVEKMLGLRIFPDEAGKMNRSVVDVGGGLLLVSQFTLYADCRKGRRPSFTDAAPPDEAKRLYHRLVEVCSKSGLNVQTGIFAADMKVALTNDGPVTIILDSRESGY